ncbi:MAG: hypothetical protein IKH44_08735 [Bacteroidales bacterium]|nr:hypothetical protein [Bacteroidales bacterium]
MKRFLFRVLFPVVVVLSALFFGGECYLRSLPNDFKTKNQFLVDNAKELKIVVLGASTVSMGIKPSCFDIQPAYNFAYASQNLEYNYWILSKCFDQMDSLKYVIMDMSSGQPWNSGDSIAPERNKFYRLYFGYPILPLEFEMSASVTELYHRIRPSNGKEAIQTIDADGYQSGYYEDVPYNAESWKEFVDWTVDYYTNRIYGEKAIIKYKNSVEKMFKIISQCQEKNVKVILVTPPVTSLYYNVMDNYQLETMHDVADSLSNAFDNVVYWDFMKADSLFTVDEFYNPTHLNPRGAKKFTLMLNDSINNLEMF